MDEQQIRLECLKLANSMVYSSRPTQYAATGIPYQQDISAGSVIATAKQLLAFVTEERPAPQANTGYRIWQESRPLP